MPQQDEEPMPKRFLQAPPLARSGGRCLMALIAVATVLATTFPARSQTVPATTSTSPAPTPNERLMRLVPEKAGDWSLHSLRGARPGPDGRVEPAAEAEFRRHGVRVTLTVTDGGAPAAPPAAPIDSTNVDGTQKIYAEGDATVREDVRRIDGRVDVALMRADGIVVSVRGTKVPAADLKALALAVRPLAR
jgi:hypothetical protein